MTFSVSLDAKSLFEKLILNFLQDVKFHIIETLVFLPVHFQRTVYTLASF